MKITLKHEIKHMRYVFECTSALNRSVTVLVIHMKKLVGMHIWIDICDRYLIKFSRQNTSKTTKTYPFHPSN